MKTTLNYKELNKIPCLTWNWLKMNRASLNTEVDSFLSTSMNIEGNLSDIKISQKKEDFDKALKKFPNTENKSQKDSISLSEQIGINETLLINVSKKIQEPLIIHFNLEDKKTYSSAQIITAEENSQITVIIDYTSLPTAEGFQAIQTKLEAKAYSKIHLIKVQLLGQNYTQIDNTDSYCAEGASIEITQIQLGGNNVFAAVHNLLDGYKSNFKSDTAYICKNKQNLDMTYTVLHKGEQTNTKMIAKGVVSDSATKTYRGTIDFKNGCHGAIGDEQEETLLLSPTVINKSIPIILCDEENVSGTHGATLGKLGADELFYFKSRGISEHQAEKIMSVAKIQSVASLIPNQNIQEKILDFIQEK